MARTDPQLESAIMGFVQAVRPREDLRRAERIDRVIGPRGTVNLGAPRFIELSSDDGTVWRLKISDAGAVTTAKE